MALKGFVLIVRILELASTALKEAELVSSRVSRVLERILKGVILVLQAAEMRERVLVLSSPAIE